MECSLFPNSYFQMGVTVMGCAEHFGLHFFSISKPASSKIFLDKVKEVGIKSIFAILKKVFLKKIAF